MGKRVRLFVVRHRCDHCRQRVDARVLYDGEQWCAWCAIADARQVGHIEGLESVEKSRPDIRPLLEEELRKAAPHLSEDAVEKLISHTVAVGIRLRDERAEGSHD